MRVVTALALLLAATPAFASTATIPVDLGVGPAAYVISGPVYRDQPVHAGLKISVQAIIDRDTLRKNRDRIPPQYRQMLESTEEVRFSPSFLIPDSLFISPKVLHTGLYGITWRPFAVGVPLLQGTCSLGLDAGVDLTSFFLYSDILPTTFFLRPGLDLTAEMELAASKSFLVSLGWSSALYVPQALGSFVAVAPIDQTVWHIGQAFFKLHFRFPYEARF